MVYQQINLQGIDPLLFGDNRMARLGEDHILSPQAPSPYTIFGAVGQFLAQQLELENLAGWDSNQNIKNCLGEFVDDSTPENKESMELLGFCYKTATGKYYFPAPRHLETYERKDKYYALPLMLPQEKTFISNCPYPKILKSNDYKRKVETDFLVSEKTLGEILVGAVSKRRLEVKLYNDIYREEFRSGLAMDNFRNVTKEAHLFNRPYWRFLWDYAQENPEWTSGGITAWVRLLCDRDLTGTDISFLGGDRRRAKFVVSDGTKDIPLANLQNKVIANISSTAGFFIYLITPFPLEQELAQFTFLDRTPVAAAIGKPVYISGWERTRDRSNQHPRPMIWAVPPGSVFFFEWKNDEQDDENKKQIIMKNWLQSVASQKYKRFGFGRILMGVWKNGNSN